MSRHIPTEETRKQVKAAAGFGLRHEKIAILLGITDKTLRVRYRKELDEGMASAQFNVAGKTYELAMKGDRTMIIWFEKTRSGMRETVQVTTPPGEPIESKGEPELIGAYFARLAAAAATSGPPGSDPGADQAVGEGGQEPHRQGGHPAPGEG